MPVALAPKLVSKPRAEGPAGRERRDGIDRELPPPVLPQQTIALIVGSQLVSSAPVQAATSQLSFSLQGFTGALTCSACGSTRWTASLSPGRPHRGTRASDADAVRPQPAAGPVMTAQPTNVVGDVDDSEAMNSAYLAAGLAWTREAARRRPRRSDPTPWWKRRGGGASRGSRAAGRSARPVPVRASRPDARGGVELDPSIAARCARRTATRWRPIRRWRSRSRCCPGHLGRSVPAAAAQVLAADRARRAPRRGAHGHPDPHRRAHRQLPEGAERDGRAARPGRLSRGRRTYAEPASPTSEPWPRSSWR